MNDVYFSPPLHGELGAVDELLLFCLPLAVVLIVLAATAQRAPERGEDATPNRSRKLRRHTEHGEDRSLVPLVPSVP